MATEGLVELEFGDAPRERKRRVDGAAIGVVHDAAVGSPAIERHDQRVGDQLGGDGGVHGPADDTTRPQVDHRGEVEPAFVGAELGDVCGPEPVGAVRVEVPSDQIRCRRRVRTGRVAIAAATCTPTSWRERISRATRLRPQRRPSRVSSACTRGAP